VIVCNKCAFQNLDDDTFCGSCGGFLEWTGESVVPKAAPAEAVAAVAKRSLLSRVQTVLSLDVYAPGENASPAGPTAGGPASTPAGQGAPSRPGEPTPSSRPGAPTQPGAPNRPAPPTRPGASAPPARPRPPTRPGAPSPPTHPASDGDPPARPAPPTRPGAQDPPSRPQPPVRPGVAPTGPDTRDAPTADSGAAAALVARGATVASPKASDNPATTEPRLVAKRTVAAGERVVGDAETTSAERPATTEAVKPQRPSDRPKPVKQKPTRKILPGDLVCGDCGEGNPPSRKFCSRCGATLAAAVVAEIAWWRRFVPRRRRKSLDAGQRPWKSADGTQKKRRGIGAICATAFAKLRPVIAVVLLLGGLLYGVSPDLRGNVNTRLGDARESVMSRIEKRYSPLAPIDASATSAVEGSPATFALDSNTLSSWIAPGDDPEPTLVARFDEPIDLERIKLWNGSAVGFKDHERIRDIHFVFDTGQSFDLEVLDLPDGKDYEIKNGTGIREVELHIVGTYSSLTSTDVGLSEIEFLIRR